MPTTPDTTDAQASHVPRLRMPTFSGSSDERVNQWIKTFDRWCTLSHYTDDQKPSLLPFVLVGTAAKIYEAWDISSSIPATWRDIKSKLENQFQDKSRKKIYEATLLKRKLLASESFDDYFADILSLCSSIKSDMSNDDKIHHLLKGLPEGLVQFIMFKDPQTPEDVLKAYTTHKTAKLLTSGISPEIESNVPAAVSVPSEHVSAALLSQFENLLKTQNEKISELQILVAKQNEDRRCFRCQSSTHMAKDCHLPRTPQPAPRMRNNSKDRDPQAYSSSRYPQSTSFHRPRSPSPGPPRDFRNYRDSRDYRDTRDPRDYRDTRDTRDYRDSHDSRQSRDNRDYSSFYQYSHPPDFRSDSRQSDYRRSDSQRSDFSYSNPDYRSDRNRPRERSSSRSPSRFYSTNPPHHDRYQSNSYSRSSSPHSRRQEN